MARPSVLHKDGGFVVVVPPPLDEELQALTSRQESPPDTNRASFFEPNIDLVMVTSPPKKRQALNRYAQDHRSVS